MLHQDCTALDAAARAIRQADALLIAAGAGMSADSGLPDYRGVTGFWRAYPPLARLGLAFEDMATPRLFVTDPHLAWGFYGHRMRLYRERAPHAGYGILRRWARTMAAGYFVFTSNVDGHFARAGFPADRLVECHGTIELLQCTEPCSSLLFPPPSEGIDVDEETMRARDPLPRCPSCGRLARPNVLMFWDDQWVEERTWQQRRRFEAWVDTLQRSNARLAIVEIGAGTAVAAVRATCELLARSVGATLVRINPHDPEGPPGCISIAAGCLETLRSLDARLGNSA